MFHARRNASIGLLSVDIELHAAAVQLKRAPNTLPRYRPLKARESQITTNRHAQRNTFACRSIELDRIERTDTKIPIAGLLF